ncbi:MAG: zinc-binding dehydrogenase [Planctomycetota bacterium]|jgi:S-(hydroxymethyl)glutathione dehydrogenase/alcohol dehydrogenase|nr:zinc-binding dehydrogenase [Planctomycetota bacterium]
MGAAEPGSHAIREPRRGLAAILAESRKPLVLDEVELPESLACGQVLVKILHSGICGSQLGEIDAVKGPDRFLPHLLGHEASGRVLQGGPGVTRVKAGDLCVLHWRRGPGIEAPTPEYRWRGRPCHAGRVTTFSQYSVVSENRLTPVEADRDPAMLPLLGCAVTTGFGVVANDAGVKIGESVVVFGAGGVGLTVIQAAAMAGAWPVIAVDLFPNRLELASRLGATHAVDGRDGGGPAGRRLLAHCGQGEGADVCIDNTGDSRIIGQCYELANPGGRVVLVGVPRSEDRVSLATLPLHFGKSLVGSHGGGANPEIDIPRYLRLFRAGKLDLAGLVGERHPLADINEALERMRSGASAGRSLIECHPGR